MHESKNQKTKSATYYIVEFKVLQVFEQTPRDTKHPAGPRPAVVVDEQSSWATTYRQDEAKKVANIVQFVCSAKDVDWSSDVERAKIDVTKAWKESTSSTNPLRGTIVFCETACLPTSNINAETGKPHYFVKHTFYPASQAARFMTDEPAA